MDLNQYPAIPEYHSYTISSLRREELGIKGFSDLEDILSAIKGMIDEMLTIVTLHSDVIPKGLVDQLFVHINTFNSFAKQIKDYNLDEDGKSNFSRRTNLISSIRNWNTSIFQGFNDAGSNLRDGNNFLTIFSAFKIYSLNTLQRAQENIDGLKSSLTTSITEANGLIETLRQKASSEAASDYALIFKNQALKHSHFSLKPFKFGSAELWLITSVVMICAFISFIFCIQRILPVDFTQQGALITVELITRLLIISFCIYLITFALKQYNVQKHLFTINKHRQNTLDSFKLFIDSLDSGEVATRNALMMEVARAIYEAGPSGYITGKDSAESSPSIIEMTKFVSQGK